MKAEERAREAKQYAYHTQTLGSGSCEGAEEFAFLAGAEWGQSNPNAAAVARVLKDLLGTLEDRFPLAHTYGSENADVYRAQDIMRNRILEGIEAMIPEPEPKEAGDA